MNDEMMRSMTGDDHGPWEHRTPIAVDYVNWRGERMTRMIRPVDIYWGSTEYHPEPQWLLKAFDMTKKAARTYALRDCVFRGAV